MALSLMVFLPDTLHLQGKHEKDISQTSLEEYPKNQTKTETTELSVLLRIVSHPKQVKSEKVI
jgi:hypothetical protein